MTAEAIDLPTAPARAAQPMAGCVVLVTADRRADQMASLFAKRGASIRHTPVFSLIPHSSDPVLLAATEALIAHPPDIVVVTTGVGFRGWVEAADYAGLAGPLLTTLAQARIIARGPKALGAIQSAGLRAAWTAPSETAAEMLGHMLGAGVAGARVAVQHHAGGSDGLAEALAEAGADVVDLVMYRLGPAPDPYAVEASVHEAANGDVDTVCFTSAMGVDAWYQTVDELGLAEVIRQRAVNGSLVVAAVGPVCAAPLRERGIEPLVPDRSRLGAMVRVVVDHYEQLQERSIPTAAGALQLRASCAVLDDRVIALTPAALDVLRLLARQPGAVVTRAEVLDVLPGGAKGEHAAEVAISRLRDACGTPGLIRTVVKRGYRLDVQT